jgi:hypothetical protein
MTKAKNDPRESEKRPYSYAFSTKRKSGCLPAEDIATLFIRVGWIGRRPEPEPLLKLAPHFDKGPGLGR